LTNLVDGDCFSRKVLLHFRHKTSNSIIECLILILIPPKSFLSWNLQIFFLAYSLSSLRRHCNHILCLATETKTEMSLDLELELEHWHFVGIMIKIKKALHLIFITTSSCHERMPRVPRAVERADDVISLHSSALFNDTCVTSMHGEEVVYYVSSV